MAWSGDPVCIERWRAVPGHEGSYEVSDHGRVRSVDRMVYAGQGKFRHAPGVMLRPTTHRDGHLHLLLQKKHWFVHQLVMLAFVGPYPDGMEICHRNGIKNDNRLSNLRYDTPRSNNLDRVKHGVHHEANKTHCPQGHPFDESNTYRWTRKDGRVCRKCKTCRQAQMRAFYDRRRSANARSVVAA
jgi:hypothetical protein